MSMIEDIWLIVLGPRNQENIINDHKSQITILGKQSTSDVVFSSSCSIDSSIWALFWGEFEVSRPLCRPSKLRGLWNWDLTQSSISLQFHWAWASQECLIESSFQVGDSSLNYVFLQSWLQVMCEASDLHPKTDYWDKLQKQP